MHPCIKQDLAHENEHIKTKRRPSRMYQETSQCNAEWIPSSYQLSRTARGLLATDHVILNHGQVTWTTPELEPPLLTTTPHQREDVSALDRFNVHRCPTRTSGPTYHLGNVQTVVRIQIILRTVTNLLQDGQHDRTEEQVVS
ncbi:uncharacterized protein TNCV_852071 [Trichonephila clavipes]|nr:uncharacterized protein TNCV_852071 [Trichonephila clavipes]